MVWGMKYNFKKYAEIHQKPSMVVEVPQITFHSLKKKKKDKYYIDATTKKICYF